MCNGARHGARRFVHHGHLLQNPQDRSIGCYEKHVQWNARVAHPERALLLAGPRKKHAPIARKLRAVHQPPAAMRFGAGDLDGNTRRAGCGWERDGASRQLGDRTRIDGTLRRRASDGGRVDRCSDQTRRERRDVRSWCVGGSFCACGGEHRSCRHRVRRTWFDGAGGFLDPVTSGRETQQREHPGGTHFCRFTMPGRGCDKAGR
jgi:hypothetical protein